MHRCGPGFRCLFPKSHLQTTSRLSLLLFQYLSPQEVLHGRNFVRASIFVVRFLGHALCSLLPSTFGISLTDRGQNRLWRDRLCSSHTTIPAVSPSYFQSNEATNQLTGASAGDLCLFKRNGSSRRRSPYAFDLDASWSTRTVFMEFGKTETIKTPLKSNQVEKL